MKFIVFLTQIYKCVWMKIKTDLSHHYQFLRICIFVSARLSIIMQSISGNRVCETAVLRSPQSSLDATDNVQKRSRQHVTCDIILEAFFLMFVRAFSLCSLSFYHDTTARFKTRHLPYCDHRICNLKASQSSTHDRMDTVTQMKDQSILYMHT